MPASYVERLIWKFFKSQVIDGYRIFVHKNVIFHTIFVLLVVLLDIYFPVDIYCVLIISSLMILCGVLAYRKPIKMQVSMLLLISAATIWIAWTFLGFNLAIEQKYLDIILSAFLFGWFLFNMTVFIFHMHEFFASTGGLFLLVGSDKNRTFLAPIPHVACIAATTYIFWKSTQISTIGLVYFVVALLLPLILIHSILSRSGRIPKAAFSIYTLMVVYSIFRYAYTIGMGINLVYWGIIALISTLFSAQKLAFRVTVKEKASITPTYFALSMLGVLLLMSYILIPSKVSESIFLAWWDYSILSLILAPILFLLYARVSGRLYYYIKRNDFTIMTLLKEATAILGKVAFEQIKQYILSKTLGSLFGK